MPERVRATTSLGENNCGSCGSSSRGDHDGLDVKPSDISRHLGISSASTTALLGSPRAPRQCRAAARDDRRSILIAPTELWWRNVVDAYDRRIDAAIAGLSGADRTAIVAFLDAATAAADDIARARSQERSFA